jgi:hypothetical protein
MPWLEADKSLWIIGAPRSYYETGHKALWWKVTRKVYVEAFMPLRLLK